MRLFLKKKKKKKKKKMQFEKNKIVKTFTIA